MKTLILSDFSKTFTTSTMPTTWSVFVKTGMLGEEYVAERNRLYETNIVYEHAGEVEKTQNWFHDHAELFAKYGLTADQIIQIVQNDECFKPRDGIAAFLKYARDNKIPVKIVTSGVVEFVQAFFVERWFGLEWIEIYGNKLIIENGKVTGVDRSVGIVPIDKSKHPFDVSHYEKIILVGDNAEDLTMCGDKSKVQSFGFTDEDRWFDTKLGKDASFEELLKKLQ